MNRYFIYAYPQKFLEKSAIKILLNKTMKS